MDSKKRAAESEPENVPNKRRVCSGVCIHPDCNGKTAVYGMAGDPRGTYCQPHAPIGAEDIVNDRCQHGDGCKKRPTFAMAGETHATHCKKHAPSGAEDVVNRRCKHPGCKKINPVFGMPGDKQGTYCKPHAPDGAENIVSKKCQHPGCKKNTPAFGMPGSKHGTHCKQHAPEGSENVIARRCQFLGCKKVKPVFAMPGSKQGTHCKQHAPEGAEDVVSKTCQHPGCKKRPKYAVSGKRGTHCKKHAPENAENVIAKRCQHPGCKKLNPHYAMPDNKKDRYCSPHAPIGAINVVCKKCQHPEGCTKHQYYGYPGLKATVCAEHKKNGMMIHPKRKCLTCKKEQALYGISEPLHCEAHKNESEFNLVHKDCISCGVPEVVGTDGRCGRCNEYLGKHLHCYKQRVIRDMLLATKDIPKFEYYDRRIDNGECGAKRPDMRWDTPGTHQLILEVDENQHHNIPCDCELVRMANLTTAIGMPVIWIRYNPDKFTGMWDDLNDKERHETLRRAVRQCLQDVPQDPTDFCRVTHLFFNGFKKDEPLLLQKIPML